MTGKKAFSRFLLALADLLEARVPLRQALETISSSDGRTKCGHLADSVLHFILEGYSLSAALNLNTVLSVKQQTVSVIAAAEKTGDVVSALRFINADEERREETAAHLVEVSLYPALVLVVAGIGTAVLFKQYRLYSFAVLPEEALAACVNAGLFLAAFLVLFCLVYYRMFSMKPLELFFYETGFLLSSGLCITDALHVISGFNERKTVQLAERMLPEIRSGVSFAAVFHKAFPNLACSEIQLFLDLASADGKLDGICSLIWKRLKKKADEKKQLALRLAEPVLLTGTGICLLILLEGAVLPFLTQFGGVM